MFDLSYLWDGSHYCVGHCIDGEEHWLHATGRSGVYRAAAETVAEFFSRGFYDEYLGWEEMRDEEIILETICDHLTEEYLSFENETLSADFINLDRDDEEERLLDEFGDALHALDTVRQHRAIGVILCSAVEAFRNDDLDVDEPVDITCTGLRVTDGRESTWGDFIYCLLKKRKNLPGENVVMFTTGEVPCQNSLHAVSPCDAREVEPSGDYDQQLVG